MDICGDIINKSTMEILNNCSNMCEHNISHNISNTNSSYLICKCECLFNIYGNTITNSNNNYVSNDYILFLVLSILVICYLCIYLNCRINPSTKRRLYIEAVDVENSKNNETDRLLDINNRLPPPYNSIIPTNLDIELD